MSVVGQFTAFERARDDAFWSLLAAHTAPEILTALDAIFPEGGGPVPTARVVERLHATLEQLRAMNARMDATAQVYLAQWRTSGWITRDLPAGAAEEVYELSAATVQALRVARSAIAPRAINTESRLAMVLEQIDTLATDTDTNPETRLARLRADRDALDREIAAVERREFHTMPDDRALERVRQILGMTSGLMADFRTVRDEFAVLNRELRRQLVESAASRPEVLEQLFSGMDLIGASPAGQSFDAFWRLLQDQGERARIVEATAAILGRPFAGALSTAERYALQDLLRTLLTESRVVYDVRQGMARNLKAFVESKEFLEQRRVMQLLSEAMKAASQASGQVRATQRLPFEIELPAAEITSVSQWQLHDPAAWEQEPPPTAGDGEGMSPEALAALLAMSDIDLRPLHDHVDQLLASRQSVTVRDLLAEFPAMDGMATVIGYLLIAAERGAVTTSSSEAVSWIDRTGMTVEARLPIIFFTAHAMAGDEQHD